MKRGRLAALALFLALGLFPMLTTAAVATQRAKASQLIKSTVIVYIADCQTAGGAPQFSTCQEIGNGSGTIISADGTILTNAHVPFDGDLTPTGKIHSLIVGLTLSAREPPQMAFFAQPTLYNKSLDLAILTPAYKLDGSPIRPGELHLPPIEIAKTTSNLDIGDDIRLIGYPGIGNESVTVIESEVAGFADDQNVPELGSSAWIKVSPNSGPGVSGGTAVDADGLLVGVPSRSSLGDIRCADTNGDGKIDPETECFAVAGSVGYIRPIEGYDLLLKKKDGQGNSVLPLPQATAAPGPEPQQPQQPAAGTAILTGRLLAADTGKPIAGGYFVVLKPGITYAKFKGDNGAKEDVLTLGVSNGQGEFQVQQPVKKQTKYTAVVIAQGYQLVYQDGMEIPSNAPAVVDLGDIKLAAQG